MVDYTKRPNTGAPATGGVDLTKVTLTKSAPTVSLSKAQGAGGHMRVNLNWSQGGKSAGGFFKRAVAANSAVDLDLGCLWETRDGRKGVVQALGNTFGSLNTPPYALLDGDDRSGAKIGRAS